MNLVVGIKSVTQDTTKAGKAYYKLVAYLDKREIEAKIWDIEEELVSGDIVEASVKKDSYKGKTQYILSDYSKYDLPEGLSRDDIFPTPSKDGSGLYKELLVALRHDMSDKGLLKFVVSVLESIKSDLEVSPAGASVHHNYEGGLLEHTLSVYYLCKDIGDKYSVDMDVLLSAAALHDIGKVFTYQKEGEEYKYTFGGVMEDHLFMGAHLIKSMKPKDAIDGPDSKIDHIIHCVLSHHGNKEWGAITTPKTISANILHYADMIDSRVGIIKAQIAKTEEENIFTEKNYFMGTEFFNKEI